jgi:predicted RND superfamily exporter protein
MRLRVEDLVLRGRAVVLAVVAAATVLAGVAYCHLTIENNADIWFAGTTRPEYLRYRDFRDRFGADDSLLVVVRAPDLFTRDVLARIDRLTRVLENHPQISRTLSLTSIETITGTAAGLEIGPLVPALDLAAPALATLRARVLADPFFPGRIVSRDGRTTVIAAEIGRASATHEADVIAALEAAIATVRIPDVEIHVAGWPAVNVLMDRLTSQDIERGLPIAFGLIALALALAFRSLRVLATIVAAVVLTILWTMGTFAALGVTGTVITVSTLPSILLALSLATAVHVVARFQEERTRTPSPQAAMRTTLRRVALPVLLTSATTAVGFGSLAIAELAPVRHLGLFAAFGMGVTCLICLTVVPIALLAFPWPPRPAIRPWLARLLARIAAFDVRHPRAIVGAALVLAVVGAVGVARLRPQGSNLGYLPTDSPPIEALRFVERHFGGATQLEIVISGPPDVAKDPVTVRTAGAVEDLLASFPEITSTVAYTALLRRMNQALHDGDPAAYRVPDTRNGIAQQLLLYETSGGAELPSLVDVSGYDVVRVTGYMTSFFGIDEWQRLYRDVEAGLAALVPRTGPPLRLELGGDGPMWLAMNLTLLDTMAESFALALAGVSLMMILLMRSVRLGLLAMIPNVVPVLLAVGLMGWWGVQLDFATVMVAGIALGIAVDDTIHYLARFRHELAADGDRAAATQRTLTTVGQAMVTTSVVLCLGFGLMMLSRSRCSSPWQATCSCSPHCSR